MGLELVGHTPNYQMWVFKIDGKTFVGRNFSSPNPLTIRFVGGYPDVYSGQVPLVDYKVLTILSSTVQKYPQGYGGSVEWVYAGKRYRNAWMLTVGVDEEESELAFDTPVPYDGPVGGPSGAPGMASESTIEARKAAEATTSLVESKESLDQGLAKLAKLEAQREIDIRDLQAARGDVAEARTLLAAAEARATAAQSQTLDQMRQAVAAAEARVNAQLANWQAQAAAAKAQADAANAALAETKESLAEAKRALAAAEARGATNSTALDSALLQLRDTREMLAATEARSTQAQAAALAELRAQIAAAEARAQAQVEAIRQSVLAAQQKAQTPPPAGTPSSSTYPGPSGTGSTPPTTPPPAPAAGGSALPLIIGAAYLLLS